MEAEVISIEPMITIEFSKYGAFARKHWASGKIEDIPVEEAMREFDRLLRMATSTDRTAR